MEEIKFCRIVAYNVYVSISEKWNYIVEVDEEQFNHVIDEAETCARVHDMELTSDVDLNNLCDDVIYKNFRIDGRIFAYILYIPIEAD